MPAPLIAVEKILADTAEPLVGDIAKKIGSSDGAVHADETYWTLNGRRAYYWLHAATHYVHLPAVFVAAWRMQSPPAQGNFLIAPLDGHVEAVPQDQMNVIRHRTEATDINGEAGGQFFEA